MKLKNSNVINFIKNKKYLPQTFKSEKVINIGLIQINNSFSGQNYLPYSIACLASYVQAHAPNPSRYRFLPLVYKRQPVHQIVERITDADIIGFSTYVWNANISLEVARRIKRTYPKTIILFGGPQVPENSESFLRENPFIDLVIHNEGERTFLNIIERVPRNEWQGLQGVSYIDSNNNFVNSPRGERMNDLSELPSPFLNGIFDGLIKENPQEKWIGLWESNRGCPFQCTFCDWGSATASKVFRFDLERIFRELEWFVKNKIEYIFVCDANFGSFKRDIEIAQFIADLRRETGYPQGFSVQSTKNATERAYITQKILSDAGLNKGVALSMQSLDAVTLENIKRDNISLKTYLELSRRFASDQVETYSDLILGLPGETYDSYVKGVDTLISAGQHNRIQFNNLSILPNAEMGSSEYITKYRMITVRSEIINIHGSREILEDDVAETQDIVIETYSMSALNWRRARVFSWMVSFLYFNKLVQIPIMLVNKLLGISYLDIFECFMRVDKTYFPVIGEIRDLFNHEANSIQKGGAEYIYSKEYLGIYWPADEYAYIKLVSENRLDGFYGEVARIMSIFSEATNTNFKSVINESIKLNRELVSEPFLKEDLYVETHYNIIELWQSICKGNPIDLVQSSNRYKVHREKSYYAELQRWCIEIVWWGNKKGAYLYQVSGVDENSPRTSSKEIAGHY